MVLGVTNVRGTGTSLEQKLLIVSWSSKAVTQERFQVSHAKAVRRLEREGIVRIPEAEVCNETRWEIRIRRVVLGVEYCRSKCRK